MPLTCPACGSGGYILVGAVGAMETYRCADCGHEEIGLAHYITPGEHESAEQAGRKVLATIHWSKGGPTAIEIAAARHALPSFQGMGLTDVKRMIGTHAALPLGIMEWWRAEALRIEAASHGITVTIDELAQDNDADSPT